LIYLENITIRKDIPASPKCITIFAKASAVDFSVSRIFPKSLSIGHVRDDLVHRHLMWLDHMTTHLKKRTSLAVKQTDKSFLKVLININKSLKPT